MICIFVYNSCIESFNGILCIVERNQQCEGSKQPHFRKDFFNKSEVLTMGMYHSPEETYQLISVDQCEIQMQSDMQHMTDSLQQFLNSLVGE